MEHSNKFGLASVGFVLIGAVLLFTAINSRGLEPSWPLVIVALAVVLLAVGFDVWRRSTPGQTGLLFDLHKYPRIANVLFVLLMLVLGGIYIGSVRTGMNSVWVDARVAAFILVGLVSYNFLIRTIRKIRAKKI
jgi:hypothetical protein